MTGEKQTIPKKNNSYHGQTEGKEKTTTTKQTKTEKQTINPFAPEPPVTARADPDPFYPL